MIDIYQGLMALFSLLVVVVSIALISQGYGWGIIGLLAGSAALGIVVIPTCPKVEGIR